MNIELVGLDESCVGGPWLMKSGAIHAVHRPHTVLVDELYIDALGVENVGQEFEMIGKRAVIGAITQGVQTFTASPFVFTSIESAIQYDKRYRDDEITYVLARCANGYTPESVRDAVLRHVPHVEVLTTRDFAIRTMKYWMLETGVGITVVVTAILGLIVGAFIMSQTLFAVTQEHIANYATLSALGFSRSSLSKIVLVQSIVLGGGGIILGSQLFLPRAEFRPRRQPVPRRRWPDLQERRYPVGVR